MKLTGPSRIVVELDPAKFIAAPQSRSGLHYLLEQLFSGEEIAVEELASWGITVREMSQDQDEFIAIPRMT